MDECTESTWCIMEALCATSWVIHFKQHTFLAVILKQRKGAMVANKTAKTLVTLLDLWYKFYSDN